MLQAFFRAVDICLRGGGGLVPWIFGAPGHGEEEIQPADGLQDGRQLCGPRQRNTVERGMERLAVRLRAGDRAGKLHGDSVPHRL